MNPFEFVLIIIAMAFGLAINIKRMELRHGKGQRDSGQVEADPKTARENRRLQEEVGELKERIKVLERITVEKEHSLSRQIDELRDR